jgi:hypothetical protein
MSHTGGGHGHGGHHGVQGGHPNQSAAWSSALQGGDKPITSLPNPTILPIFFALLVFVIMLLPFIINWGEDGVELPWANKQSQVSQDLTQSGRPERASEQQATEIYQAAGQAASSAAAVQEQSTNAPPASYEQQLLYASQQSYGQNANQQTQAVNPAAQQTYAAQPNYAPAGSPQENFAPSTQGQRRHRVWVER